MAYDELAAKNPKEKKIRRRNKMKKTIQLGLLGAVVSAFLALPLSPSFNPQPDPPIITSPPSALLAFNPQPDPPGFV
jgi:hypothetical protein